MKFEDNSQEAKDAIKEASIKFLFEACLLVQGRAALLAPVGYTGNLRDSIDYVVDEDELVGYIGTNSDYGVYVEFGTGEFAENGQGRKGGWVYKNPVDNEFYFTWGQDPQPYLRPAFRESKAQIESLLKSLLSQL